MTNAGTGHFTFGNATLNSLSIPEVQVNSGDLTVNAGSTLSVTGELRMGYEGTGAINLAPGAGLQLGTAVNPIPAYVGYAYGTATLAPNSATNPGLQYGVTNAGTGHFTFGNATLNSLSIPEVQVNSGDLTVNAGATLHITAGMSVGPDGRFILGTNSAIDLTNTEMIINYGTSPDPISTIAGYVRSGYNGGAWNGPGINSSTAAQTSTNSLRYGLGYADGADGVVSGLSSGQIEVRYTLLGDANLDGLVNAADFTILAANFNQPVTGWDQGNFNYDAIVNAADFTDLAANFNQGVSGAAVSAGDVAALDAFAAANGLPLPTFANVPEPASAGIIMMAGLEMVRRRRRR
ncbi:MAG: hypothetical protein ABSH08_07400 [Tepidisphaeraceae bacterium]